MRALRRLLAVMLIAGFPSAALAQSHASQGHPSQGGAPPRQAAPAPPRPAPPVSQPRVEVPSQPHSGFSFPHDVYPAKQPRPIVQPAPPVKVHQPYGPPKSGAPGQPSRYPRAPYNPIGGPYHGQFHGPVIYNPHHWGGWGWNRGVPWYPAPIYWGGGFWGPFAISGFVVGVLFGSIIDYQNQVIYPSYQVEPSSPGAQLLQNYGLQQTECGPPDLVVIWGPGNSVICAFPNNLVAAGNYQLDPTTLSLVSR